MSFYRPHDRVTQPVGGPSRTKQAFKEECDINNILRKYEKTGLLTHVAAYNGRYEDLPDPIDYQEALHQLRDAEAAFMSLPSRLRRDFNNDPAAFLAFVSTAKQEELVELGLAHSPSTPSRAATPSQSGEQPETQPGKDSASPTSA